MGKDDADEDSFSNYVPTAVDPGNGLFIGTTIVILLLMGCFMPSLVCWTKRTRRIRKHQTSHTCEKGGRKDASNTLAENALESGYYVRMNINAEHNLKVSSKPANDDIEAKSCTQTDHTTSTELAVNRYLKSCLSPPKKALPYESSPEPDKLGFIQAGNTIGKSKPSISGHSAMNAKRAGSYMLMETELNQSAATETGNDIEKVHSSVWTVLRIDKESRRVLSYALPFSFSAISKSIFSNACLAIVGLRIGTKEVAAYAIAGILVGLSEEFVKGPLYSNTALCAHAIGAANNFLAGQYVQLSVLLYLLLSVPFIVLWYHFSYEIVLRLEWGDTTVASYAQTFVLYYVWSILADCIQVAVTQLLDVTGHEIFTTATRFCHGLVTVLILLCFVVLNATLNLQTVGIVFMATSFANLFLTTLLAYWFGWLKPFEEGLFKSWSFRNIGAVRNMLKTALPLSLGSVLSNAEWAILTIFAAYMGPAEVAAWAMLGSIWDIFYCVTSGIGDAAEIRVAYHLGNNHPSLAKLSAYKSLFLGMVVAVLVSVIFFSVMEDVPGWFTSDETLQSMLLEVLPFIGVGNLAMTFGMLCWYMVGAQGRYKLGTWITFVASWGVTMPLAAVMVYYWNIDLQGLTAAVVLGYVGVGASLSYILLTSDWQACASKIQRQTSETGRDKEQCDAGTETASIDDEEEAMYATVAAHHSRAAQAVATRNLKVLTAPPGPLGIRIASLDHRQGGVVVEVFSTSPCLGSIYPGDCILSVDGIILTSEPADVICEIMNKKIHLERELTFLTTPCHYRDEETTDILLSGNVPDIPDFEDKVEGEGLHIDGGIE